MKIMASADEEWERLCRRRDRNRRFKQLLNQRLELWSAERRTQLRQEKDKEEQQRLNEEEHRRQLNVLRQKQEYPVLLTNEKPDPVKLEKVHDALALLETFLEGHLFAVGNRITVADFCLVATVSTMDAAGVDLTKYRNIHNWYERCKGQMRAYDEANGRVIPELAKFVKPKLRL
ncbi:Glutathione S-transferase C-terminal-like [Trinorchestia longiramus]|nr:Glutathione S-transferase C-terminal-like [Trinorchestia longiramus]